MQPINIALASLAASTGSPFPVSLGVPFTQRETRINNRLQGYLRSTGEAVPTQATPLAFWPDGSIRWLLVRLMVPAGKTPNDTIELKEGAETSPPILERSEATPQQNVQLRIGDLEYTFSTGMAGWTQRHLQSEPSRPQQATLSLTGSDGEPGVFHMDGWTVLEQGEVCTRIQADGQVSSGHHSQAFNVRIALTLYVTGLVATKVRLHNPHRARHPGGLWDLGDPGSLHFQSLTLNIETPSVATPWLKPEHERPECIEGKELRLHQESSGGENWNSANHQDAAGNITPGWRGYQCHQGDTHLYEGARATPLAGIGGGARGVAVSLEDFWQNFPSAIGISDTEIQVGLFPAIAAGPHELQGGERKTQTVFIEQGGSDAAALCAYSHPIPSLSPDIYARAQAFPWFNPEPAEDSLQPLIRKGIEGPHNFFHKREIIDEYGWRHFGELFADHETLYQEPTERPFISHYNNQYDPVYGFARQFALTGDRRWFELMNDLARHVTDIDIYHTDEDRTEYNNGLFWHTDHYLDAHTATHRTFTRHNTTTSTGETGGGPGAEHCYTTGLLYHYWMTGNEDSAEAVLKLAQWLRNSFEDKSGLLAQILAFKKQELPLLKTMLKGHKPLAHTYPFTRATGNYLNTLLDAWLLSGEQHWLDSAEKVIEGSIHPNDEPGQRNLLDVESGWSYLVLLTSLAKYLLLKDQREERDSNYAYARHALIRYTRWMRQNERSFLAETKQLEYPNQTWTAQDVRKAMLLYIARYIDPDHAGDYQRQADEWLKDAAHALEQSPESNYTRVLAILMQNHGPHTLESNPGFSTTTPALPDALAKQQPRLSWPVLLQRMLRRALSGLTGFRPGKEKAWLQARLDR